MPVSYDPLLVVLSFVVAVGGSYAALDMAPRMLSAQGRQRPLWLFGGSLAQGFGIWSMHFVGMLALSLPVPMAYDTRLMAISFLIASAGALVAFVLTHRALNTPSLLAGGLAIGASISGLHYVNMSAMRMAADTTYTPSLVVASILISVVFGLLSLWLSREHRNDAARRLALPLWAGAIAMGIATTGMHYTGMAAVRFPPAPDSRPHTSPFNLSQPRLHAPVLLAAAAILGLALTGSATERTMRRRMRSGRLLRAAQESERRRIARNLHDDVGQLLTAARLTVERLAGADAETGRRLVAETADLLDLTLGRVRDIAMELRPAVLDDFGLVEALNRSASRYAERSGYTLAIEENLRSARLPAEIENAAFRIAQQALTNIARHARARSVTIGLRRTPAALELTIRDDGTGFDPVAARARADAGESLGIIEMSETASCAGGRLTIASRPGHGTTVRAVFPLAGS